ncbi:tryptophan synthase subunit alpha [Candidatus Desantisbacteria bacterium]|nr:tryptophan synthase subunit alpha [Candidatus Desantisbacteria bacterium]
MTELQKKLQSLKDSGKKFFIPYITAGYPSLAITEKLVISMEQAGADAIELGIPFSDPLADGPIIQLSSYEALLKGVTLSGIFEFVGNLRNKTKIPIIFMTYYNPVYKYGIEQFSITAEKYGVSGVIVPDLPPEEASLLIKSAKDHNLAVTFLFTPTSNEKRIKLITSKSTGFIYYVSLAGVTGTRDKLAISIQQKIEDARKFTDKPIAVGFGISTPMQAKEVAAFADGVIVGSAIVKKITENVDKPDIIENIKKFVMEISNEIHSLNKG